MPYISNDPDMQELIRQKAANTSPEKLCEEIEAMHDALHDMKSHNAAMFRCIRENKTTMQNIMKLEQPRGPDADYIVRPLARQCSKIVETMARVKGIIE